MTDKERIEWLKARLRTYDCAWGTTEPDPEHTCTALGGPPCVVLQRDRATKTRWSSSLGRLVPWETA